MIGAGLLARDLVDGVPTGAIEARPVSGRLVVCPTPIGNLEDVTLRVLAALREADVVACEDTRHTKTLLDRYGVNAKLVSYHEHNERARASELVERMRGGRGRRAGVRRRDAAGERPGLPARAGLRRRGPVRRGAARAVVGDHRAGRQRAADRRLALRRLPPAQARPAGDRSSPRPRRSSRSSRPKRVGAIAGDPRRARPRRARSRSAASSPSCTRRSSAAAPSELAARYADEPPRGEIVLVVGGAPEPHRRRPRAHRRRPQARRVRRPRPGRRERRRRAHRRRDDSRARTSSYAGGARHEGASWWSAEGRSAGSPPPSLDADVVVLDANEEHVAELNDPGLVINDEPPVTLRRRDLARRARGRVRLRADRRQGAAAPRRDPAARRSAAGSARSSRSATA